MLPEPCGGLAPLKEVGSLLHNSCGGKFDADNDKTCMDNSEMIEDVIAGCPDIQDRISWQTQFFILQKSFTNCSAKLIIENTP